MSQIRLYIDEDAGERAVVDGLRGRGVDLMTVVDSGMNGLADSHQLKFAAQIGRAIYSLNVGDFCQLHHEWLAQGQSHAGIILVPRQRYSTGEKVRRLLELIDAMSAEEICNTVEFL